MFVDAEYPTLVRYDGDQPWTHGAVTQNIPGWPNESATEHWAACVNDQGTGSGVFFPGTSTLTTYRFEGDGKQGPTGSACSYFSPVRTFSVRPNMNFHYNAYLTLGTVEDIRTRFGDIQPTRAVRDGPQPR